MALVSAKMHPILCVGESLKEHESNLTNEVITRQLKRDLQNVNQADADLLTIAYEPI